MKQAYCLDLDSKHINSLEILDFSGDDLELDLKTFAVSNPRDLSDYDRKVFNSERAAQKYLDKWNETLADLDCSTDSSATRDKNLKCILYKTRYMIQTLMREKNNTFRDSPYPQKIMESVKPGDCFYLTNQKQFLCVRLLRTKKEDDGTRYFFELA